MDSRMSWEHMDVWSDPVRLHGWRRYDYKDIGGRITPGAVIESRVWNNDRGLIVQRGSVHFMK